MNSITVEKLYERKNNGEKLHLLDVREPHENAEFNIGGLLIPLGNVQMMQIDELDEWKNEEIICYCRSGKRSMQACMLLNTYGFTNVKNLTGGMINWQEKFSK